MHFVYKQDHLFQSTRLSYENSSVTKTFHFSKIISTEDFFASNMQHSKPHTETSTLSDFICFISAAARTSSSSSQTKAFGPTLLLYFLWACWAVCGPGSWPNIGFQVVSRPFWPSRWLLFLFLEEK